MSVISGPDIIDDNLLIHLDAANDRSYAGTGTVWYDLSGFNRNVTLVNGVSYSTSNNGIFLLDGTNDEININEILFPKNAFTYDIWLRPTLNDTMKIFWMGEMQIFFSTISKNIYRRWYNNNTTAIAYQEAFTENYSSIWTSICWTVGSYVDIMYINGFQVGLNRNSTIDNPTITGYNGQVNSAVYIGRDEELIYKPFDVAAVKMYNRVLTANEVRRNFNASRGRFGI